MEEPVERKDAAVGIAAKEPLKTEGIVPSPDTSERSEGASSPPPNCSICLGKLRNTSFTDSCLHQFCFTCLLQWSKIKTECPLCKQTFKSIIHNVRSEEDYDQYHVPRELASQLPSQQITALDVNYELFGGQFRRFVYRTTMTPNRRYGVLLNPEQVARHEQIPNVQIPTVSREERRYRRLNSTNYRRNVYLQGEWSNFLPNIHGRLRECSAEYYRRNPHELNRLIPWINRELQILLNGNESHIAYVLNVITDSLSRFDIRGPEFRDTVRPYFGPYTDHFAHELLNYARTSFDIVGYDQYVTYPSDRRGLSGDYVGRVISPVSSVSSTSSDDSDVRVVDQTIDVSRISVDGPSVGPHVIDMPGPSTVGETFQVPRMTSAPDILTISSSASSSDECEVVGYVKPRHERTPEVIELVSSDGGIDPVNNRDANCRTPCEIREPEVERAGPSHEVHRRRVTRKSSRPHRSSTISDSNTNSDSDPDKVVHRNRKKSSSSRRAKNRGRLRKSRETEEKRKVGGSSRSRSRSGSRRREISSPSSSVDLSRRRRKLRRDNNSRSQTLKELGLENSESGSDDNDDSCASKASKSCAENSRASSRGSSVRCYRSRIRKTAKERKEKNGKRSGIYSSTNSSSSTTSTSSSSSLTSSSSSSSSSSFNDSDSDTAWSGESTTTTTTKRRRKVARSRRKSDISIARQDEKSSRRRQGKEKEEQQQQQQQQQQPVNATILRKDSTRPNEWYVKKRSLRVIRSRSRSSSSLRSGSDNPRTLTKTRRGATICDEKKDRKDSTSGYNNNHNNPGCSRNGNERKGLTISGRTKRESDFDSSASEFISEVRGDSVSRGGSGISGRTRAKERSRHKDVSKRRRIRSESSGSGSRRRDQESRSDQAKRKERSKRGGDRGRKRDRGSRTSDQAKRNDRERCGDHGRKREETSKCRDQERKIGDQEEMKNDHERKKGEQGISNDCGRKIGDHASRNNGTRKKNDHARRNDDDLNASASRHSENERKCISKDKHKSKKKQKVKRRRSRSESKCESRNSRHRMARSSSYSPPTTKCDEQ